MPVNPDFRDLFSAFNAAGVRYLLVGGYAVAFHAEPRFTKGLDLGIEVSPSNAERAHAALREFGAPLGQTAWPHRVETEYGGERIWVIGRDDLIPHKRASGRPQDALDVATLERHRRD